MTDWKQYVRSHLPSLRLSGAREQEVIEELSQQLESAYNAARAEGASTDEAIIRATAQFPDWAAVAREINLAERPVVTTVVENLPPRFGRFDPQRREKPMIWSDFWQDVRYSLRTLAKAPAFTAVIILTLALGIGANTAIFTLVDAVLLKSLPVRDPSQLLLLGNMRTWGVVSGQTGSYSVFSYDLYKHLRDDTGVFEGLCAFQSEDLRVSARRSGSNFAQPVVAKLVSGNYFGVLGVSAALGRSITPEDDSASAPAVAVVSFRYWINALNRNSSVTGSTIELGGVPVTIIGVAAPGFFGETLEPDPADFWLPLSADRQINRQRTVIDTPDEHWLFSLGRLNPGISRPQAEARLTATLQTWLSTRDIPAEWRTATLKSYIELTPGGSGITHMQRRYSEMLRLLLGISMLVLLITCANVANLLLARGTARSGESAIRLALGATRGRLMRQSLTESLTLAFTGAALGLLAATVGTRLLITLVFRGADFIPIQTAPDLRVLVFALGLSIAAAFGFGLVPAIRSARCDLTPVLKGTSQRVKGSILSRGRIGFARGLIIGQIALSLVLMAAAGLFARSLANLTGQQFGFDRQHLLILSVDPELARYEYGQLGPLYQRLYARLNSLPGVTSAAFSLWAPFTECCWSSDVSVEGYVPKPTEDHLVVWNRVSPQYFETLGTKLVLGRLLDVRDTPNARRVAVVNQTFVHRFSANQNPLGKHISIGDTIREFEIVGVVEDAKYTSPREEPTPMAFLPLLQVTPQPGEPPQSPQFRSNLVHTMEIRAAGDPGAIGGEARQAVADIDPNLFILRINTLSSQLNRVLSQENVIAELAAFFGLLALLLVSVGLYGVLSYNVTRRRSEIGLRMALGAQPGNILAMILREAMLVVLAGAAVGLVGALAAGRVVASLLYGLQARDPATLGLVALVLLVVATLAAALPAWRASRVDPLVTLRYE